MEANEVKTEAMKGLVAALSGAFSSRLTEMATRGELALGLQTRFLLLNALHEIFDIIFGSSIVRVPRQLIGTVKASNRTVSFILDGRVHYGTGILVSPCHVLTAAHLFLDETGRVIDSTRAGRTTVEAQTTYFGNIIMEGPRRGSELATDWLLDPKLDGVGKATRDVKALDFAIVTLKERLGNDPVGNGITRDWVTVPTAGEAQLLSPNLALRIFQFLDREALFTSSGSVRKVNPDGMRVLHTASTLDSSSGSAIFDDEFNLVALHLGGAASGELPKSNRGLPVRRIAESIDEVRDGTTVRAQLK